MLTNNKNCVNIIEIKRKEVTILNPRLDNLKGVKMNRRILILALCFSVLTVSFLFGTNDLSPTLTGPNKPLLSNQKQSLVGTDRSDLLFDQQPTGYNTLDACQNDPIGVFYPRIADNFTVEYDASVDSLVWWGGFWNFDPDTHYITNFNIEIYPDSAGFNQPMQAPIYTQTVAFTETFISVDYYMYTAVIPPFAASTGETYWIVFQPFLTLYPQWGNNCDEPPAWGDGQQQYFKSASFGFPLWTPAITVFGRYDETSFQIYGTTVGVTGNPGETSTLDFGLLQNTPNPFRNGKTAISYTTSRNGSVRLSIYDNAGRLIKTLIDRTNESAGHKTIYWDGMDNNNRSVAAGVYFYKLTAEDRTATKRMVFVR